MKYLDEYREKEAIQVYLEKIRQMTTRSWNLMEVCGGQTHSIIKYGIDKLLPKNISLIHGPGCPICVTPIGKIDLAIQLALRENTILCTFGDMLRVPGSSQSLAQAKATGGDVKTVYSPLDAVTMALNNPDKEVVFFAVGFETTAPANALALVQAESKGLKNFSLLASHVLVPPAIEAIMQNPKTSINGFLAAGHVCAIMGEAEYSPLASKYQVPIVISGFEPLDIVQGIYWLVRQLENQEYKVENQYSRVVPKDGNSKAQELLQEVFQVFKREWRGIGIIAESGLELTSKYSSFDAEKKFSLDKVISNCQNECQSGEILQGLKRPWQCPSFGSACTPEKPLGATMVSEEGACHAYFLYRGHQRETSL
jgi:hydrogenase expression/formation protein HypD